LLRPRLRHLGAGDEPPTGSPALGPPTRLVASNDSPAARTMGNGASSRRRLVRRGNAYTSSTRQSFRKPQLLGRLLRCATPRGPSTDPREPDPLSHSKPTSRSGHQSILDRGGRSYVFSTDGTAIPTAARSGAVQRCLYVSS
jgi:hypothetical protein